MVFYTQNNGVIHTQSFAISVPSLDRPTFNYKVLISADEPFIPEKRQHTIKKTRHAWENTRSSIFLRLWCRLQSGKYQLSNEELFLGKLKYRLHKQPNWAKLPRNFHCRAKMQRFYTGFPSKSVNKVTESALATKMNYKSKLGFWSVSLTHSLFILLFIL